jgi:DNA replication and repair protein RecF
LAAYEQVVVEHGAELEKARGKACAVLSEELAEVSEQLFVDGQGGLAITYSSFWEDGIPGDALADRYRDALVRSRERDVREGRTCVGPHLANVNIHLAGRPVARYGSEGECRLTAIALRLASLGAIRRRATEHRAVILLVDDVFGELDTHRRKAFFTCVSQADQSLVTGTEIPAELAGSEFRVFHVQAGDVEAR